jgi:hypothetical protein
MSRRFMIIQSLIKLAKNGGSRAWTKLEKICKFKNLITAPTYILNKLPPKEAAHELD